VRGSFVYRIDECLSLWVRVWVERLLPTDCAVANRMVPRFLDWDDSDKAVITSAIYITKLHTTLL
jgi:hypothetical protein